MRPKGRLFNFKPSARIHGKFKSVRLRPKSLGHLDEMVAKKSALRRVVGQVFSKKGLAAAGVGTAVGVGVSSIWNYIESNSGCFRRRPDGSVCKALELSCCQRDALDNVAGCPGLGHLRAACDGFDEDAEGSCCKLCSCDGVDGCPDGEEMRCQRPTVADALTHFAEGVQSGVWSAVGAVFPWAPYALYAALALLALWLLSLVLPLLQRLVPRRRGNQDA